MPPPPIASGVTLDLAAAADRLAAGEVVAFPTETVYGLGADIGCVAAVRRLFEIKGRPPTRALPILLADAADAAAFAATVPGPARRLMARGWPGPLTVVVPAAPHVPRVVTGGLDTVGLRVPDHDLARALVRALGTRLGRPGALAAPSANPFGAPPPVTAHAVRAGLGPGPYGVLDGGACPGGVPSTVVAVAADGSVTVLRAGAIDPATVHTWATG